MDLGTPALPATDRSRVVRALDRIFGFSARGSSVPTELLAGVTTFGTLSYILVVNPLILADAGMNRGALITVTALVAALFTLVVGLRTNYPLAMAPGMGVNAYVAIQVCQGMHIAWPAALGMVFYSGLLFLLLTISGIRRRLIDAFPDSFKTIIGAAIGCFIAFLALRNAHIIVAAPATFVTLGSFGSPTVLLGFGGFLLTAALVHRRIPGALVISIMALTAAGLFLPGPLPGSRITQFPHTVLSLPNSIGPVFLKLDLLYPLQHPFRCLPIVLAILFSDLFGAMATLIAVGAAAGLVDEHGNLPKLRQALSADASASSIGALLGSTTPIIYLESAAGVEQGGRTGLASVATSACFIAALFLTPIIAIMPAVATSPALLMIAILMMQRLGELDFTDIVVAASALVTILLMVLASASDGLALGFITNIVLLALVGRHREIRPVAWFLVALFVVHYIAG